MPIFTTELFPGISEHFELLTVMKSNGQITKLATSMIYYPTILPESAFADVLQTRSF